VAFNLSPERLLTYVAFFLPLSFALSASAAIAIYMIELRAGRFPMLGPSIRRGILVAAILIVNLAFQAAHRWSVPVAGVSILGAIALEVVAERKSA
jgi:hypothetical protein